MEKNNDFIIDGTGNVSKTTVGMPQGLPISPIISILVLEQLEFLANVNNCKIIQYADDGIIIGNSLDEITIARDVLKSRCKGGIFVDVSRHRSLGRSIGYIAT